MTVPLIGLDHIVLRVADAERAVRFYCDVLGCYEERRVHVWGVTIYLGWRAFKVLYQRGWRP